MAIYRWNEPEWVRELPPTPDREIRRDPIGPLRARVGKGTRPECDTCDREMNRSRFTTCGECRRRAKLRESRRHPRGMRA